jgi:ribulose-phosphate 3-epimerase
LTLTVLASPSDVMNVLNLIHDHDMKAGLAISPNTPAESVTDQMGNAADLLLVMTVHPGRGGQKFMPECLKKVEELRQRFPGKNIQVDGGVGKGNACQCAQAGTFTTLALCMSIGKEGGKSVKLTRRIKRPCCRNCRLWSQGS